MAAKLSRRTVVFWLVFMVMGLILAPMVGAAEAPGTAALLVDSDYYPTLLEHVREARKSIDLAMYLWRSTKSPRNKPRQLIGALGDARRRGVKIRVVLENSGRDRELNRANEETALLLKKEGIAVLFDSKSVTTHAKLAVIDGRFIFLGSHNLTHSALEQNHELSLLLDDPGLAAQLTTYLGRLTTP